MPNISDYSNNKIICTFYKERSPNSIVIVDDVEDSWFKYVITYKTRSGKVEGAETIIESDLISRITFIEHSGYKIKK